jgi:poly(3-hydroxybutyrate) depolymerase
MYISGHIGVHLLPLLVISDLPVIVSFHGATRRSTLHKPAHLTRTRRMFDLATLLLVRSESIAERLDRRRCRSREDPAASHRIPLDEINFHCSHCAGRRRLANACKLAD